jgi:heme-degrading monooxygenase HmoA
MFILHVDCVLRPNSRDDLLRVYRDKFMPAISAQPGYVNTMLLKPLEECAAEFRLVIAFENHERQQAWVKTDAHEKVWPEMEASIREYAVHSFETR